MQNTGHDTTARPLKMKFLTLLAAAGAALVTSVQTPIELQSAGDYAILAGSSITSTGVVGTVINGDMALYPGTDVSGFPPAVCNGMRQVANPVSLQVRFGKALLWHCTHACILPVLCHSDF